METLKSACIRLGNGTFSVYQRGGGVNYFVGNETSASISINFPGVTLEGLAAWYNKHKDFSIQFRPGTSFATLLAPVGVRAGLSINTGEVSKRKVKA